MSELELRLAWERFVAPPTVADSQQEYDSVVSRHAEPQRHYHTGDHVVWVLRHLDSFDHPDIDRALAGAAAFYHDAIYDPTRTDNEDASAALSRSALSAVGWATERAEAVAAIIEATKTHEIVDDVTTSALCSADLGVLASEPNEYREYVNQVRREYHFLDDSEWRTGRTAVLNGFLARPAIFDARLVADDWEARARANIAAEIATLED